MLEKLEKILSIEKKEHQYDWEKVEDSYEIKFPNDYKSFIEYYGEGGINEFLWILSPFSEYENLNTIFKFNEMREAYEIMKIDFPKMCEFEFGEMVKVFFHGESQIMVMNYFGIIKMILLRLSFSRLDILRNRFFHVVCRNFL